MSRDSTFGALAIGDTFEWRDTAEIQHGPPGPEPMKKTSPTHYGWSRGVGTAEPHYPVRKIRIPRETFSESSEKGSQT